MIDPDPSPGQLRARITKAFGHLRHDDAERLYDAELADDYGQETALTRRLHDLTYEQWSQIPDWAIAQAPSALSFLSPEAYRFHLPAYMVWTLENYDTSNSLSADMTIYSLLVADHYDDVRALKLARFELFDHAQRNAVVTFLRFAASHGEYLDAQAAQRALDSYWAASR